MQLSLVLFISALFLLTKPSYCRAETPGGGSFTQVSAEDYLKWRDQEHRLSETGTGKSGSSPGADTNAKMKEAFSKAAELGREMQIISSGLPAAIKEKILSETKLLDSSSGKSELRQIEGSNRKVIKLSLAGNDWRIKTLSQAVQSSKDPSNLYSIYQMIKATFRRPDEATGPTTTLPEINVNEPIEAIKSKLSGIAKILKELQTISLRKWAINQNEKTAHFEILCSQREIGSATGSDSTGQVVATQFRLSQVFADTSLIANFDYPLKSSLSCIKDQGNRGTGAAFAITSGLETRIEQKLSKEVNLSEQSFHFQAKTFWEKGDPSDDDVITFTALSEAKKASFRIPLEKSWPYNPSPGRIPPFFHSCDAYQDFCSDTSPQGKRVCADLPGGRKCGLLSQGDLIEGAEITALDAIWDPALPDESTAIAIHYLQNGFPLIQDLIITQNFLKSTRGFVKTPQSLDQNLGGHTLLLVGYLPTSIAKQKIKSALDPNSVGYFIAKNSWGPTVGDGGYFYLPVEYVKKYTLSMVAIRDAELVLSDSSSTENTVQEMGNLGGVF